MLIPAGLIFSFFIFGLLVFAAIRLRRMSMPLDEMLEALKKLAEGDYSVRMGEAGWPEVRQMARGFNSMVEKMGENDQQRRNMLADISHELRNPISVIQGNLEGMLDGVYSTDQAQLKSLYEETQMLSRLVDDLKTFALAEAGALPLKREPTDIGALVRDTVSTFEAQAKEKGILLQVQSAYSGDVDIDPLRIREVLANLLANAIRHTPRGGAIRLGVSETSRGEERSVTVVVHDNGPGVESDDLGHIFDRFYKSSDSGGMGLGLSIAKVLVEAHGGRIWAENEGGAKISFSLVQ
jgi:signal transduction histidine kinase